MVLMPSNKERPSVRTKNILEDFYFAIFVGSASSFLLRISSFLHILLRDFELMYRAIDSDQILVPCYD